MNDDTRLGELESEMAALSVQLGNVSEDIERALDKLTSIEQRMIDVARELAAARSAA